MRCPPAIADEDGRLLALSQYGLDEKQGLPDLEPVVKIAAQMLDMPIAAVNMVGSDHVFFAASVGIGECNMSRDVSFCAHAIAQNDVMVVLDTRKDPRFYDNPLVGSSTGIRFYAGVPLHSPTGHALGALCVIDSKPREFFSNRDRARLKELAELAGDRLERCRLENACRDERLRFEDIAATSPSPIFCFDSRRILTFWNPVASTFFGYEETEIVGRPLHDLIPGTAELSLRRAIQRVSGALSLPSGETRRTTGLHKDGTPLPIDYSLFTWTASGSPHYGVVLEGGVTSHR